jgi:hypothetical protein
MSATNRDVVPVPQKRVALLYLLLANSITAKGDSA